jgi:hypothetical protein
MKFRKKPVVIEAFQLTPERMNSNLDWPNWLHEAWNKSSTDTGCFYTSFCNFFYIVTLEGNHKVSENDWIVKGIAGELYPCNA